MASAENIPLTDFLNLYLESARVLLIKNVSDNTPRDILENYLAAIINANVTGVHYPADVTGCCVVVFHRPIKGIWNFGHALDEHPLDGNVLDLCSLGRCDGLLIRNAPTELSSATLEGFLKSEEFTGTTEDCVKSIQYVNSVTGRFMLVQVPDIAVVSRILNRPEQPRCQNHDIDIDPYFPNLHDLIGEHNDHWKMPCSQMEVYEAGETVSYETCQEKDETADLYHREDSNEIDSGFSSNILIGSNETKRTSPFQINMYPDTSSLKESGESVYDTDSESVQDEKECNETDKDISSVSNGVCGVPIQTDEQTVNSNALCPSLDNISNNRSEDNLNLMRTKVPGSFPVSSINSVAVNMENADDKTSLHFTDASEPSAQKDVVEQKHQPVTRRKRFHRKANELQYGLSEEEALKHAMEQSLLDHKNSTTDTSVRPGSNGGVEETLPSEVVQKLLTANQPEFGTESTMFKTNEYYSGDPPMSQIDSAFTQAPHKSLVRSSSQESFGSNSTRLDVATSRSDWIGQGAIPKSGGRQSRKGQKFIQSKVQEFQPGKSDDLALDEAIAKSLAEQEEKKTLHNKHRPGQGLYRRQRSHSLDGKDKGKQAQHRPTSSGEQEHPQDNKQGPRTWQKGRQAAKYVPDSGAAFAGFLPDSKQGSGTWQKGLQAAKYVPDLGAAIADVRHSTQEKQSKAFGTHQNEAAKQAKGQVVYQQPLDKKPNISDEARTKIRETLKKHHVRSKDIAASKKYMLEGEEESVKKAYTEILETLVKDVTENEREAIKSRRARRKEIMSKPEKVIEYMALKDDDAVPDYWKNFKPGSLITHALQSFKLFAKDFIRVDLDSSDPVFKAIEKTTQSTWDELKVGHGKDAKGLDQLGYRRIRITKIQRIENLKLYERYSAHRKRTFIKTHQKSKKQCKTVENLPGSYGRVMTQGLTECPVFQHELFPQVNEHFFFHGTSKGVIDVICNSGLDSRVASLKAMYGAGIYGAESSTKADQYVVKHRRHLGSSKDEGCLDEDDKITSGYRSGNWNATA